jgi:hypothetical protein
MRLFILLTLSFLQACIDNTATTEAEQMIARDQACEQQAAVWCGTASMPNSPNSPCVIDYLDNSCLVSHAPIPDDEQNACIDAILHSDTPSIVPDVCVATWI